jgi:hypothetical protein
MPSCSHAFLQILVTVNLQQALYLKRHERSKMDFDETSDKLIGLLSTRKWPNALLGYDRAAGTI